MIEQILLFNAIIMLITWLVLLPAVSVLFLTAYSIWMSKTGGFGAIAKGTAKADQGLGDLFAYHMNKKTGKPELMPFAEAAALAAHEREEANAEELEELDQYADGIPGAFTRRVTR